jgi:hypothetical protein
MTFKDRYDASKVWHEKAIVIELYHLTMHQQNKNWTLIKTAKYFHVSIGLVSENLRLADAIHYDAGILKCETRQDALKRLNGSKWRLGE